LEVFMTAAARRQRRLGGRSASLVSLTALDRRIVGLLSEQRVITSVQLELLLADVPARTLRYRTERLHHAGLAGRSRPYRDSGSAPYHLWPTRRADALARGAPPPAGGERQEPNPLFLAHAAGLTDLYVALVTHADGVGPRLDRFAREAREQFVASGRRRALAPDALVCLHDEQDRELWAFMELDLGTMSHTRLKTKASGYAAYATEAAWQDHYEFCPCLLFLTTSEARAVAFLKTLAGLLGGAGRGYGRERWAVNVSWFAAGACALAHEPARMIGEPCWDDLALAGGGLTLSDCLHAARAPYDAWLEQHEQERKAHEQMLHRLHTNPRALREHLREGHGFHLHSYLERFGKAGHTALRMLIDAEEAPDAAEREALFALARYIGDERLIDGDYYDRPSEPPAPAVQAMVAALAERYRTEQQTLLARLCARYGEGPSVRAIREILDRDGLVWHLDETELEKRAYKDGQARVRRRELRSAYFHRREREARRWARENGLRAWLHGPAPYYEPVDRRWLRFCTHCHEIDFPLPDEKTDRWGNVPGRKRRCLFCASQTLAPWEHEYWRLGDPLAASNSTSPARPLTSARWTEEDGEGDAPG
jgi:hypothetical protein